MEMQGQPMPAEEAAPQEGGGKEAETIIKGIAMAIDKVKEMIPQLGGSEEDAAALDKVNQAYQAVMSKVMGGGEAEEMAPVAPQQSPAMGGAKGVPVG